MSQSTIAGLDTYLAIASKRDERRYADDRPIPADVVERILDAGRLAGSAKNVQPWRFLVVESADVKDRLAETVYAPANVRTAALVVAIAGKSGLDVGRAVQNMFLAAWNDGVVSCPNGMPEPERAAEALALRDEPVAIVLSFGYPATPRKPERRPPAEWSARANRKPLGEVVEKL